MTIPIDAKGPRSHFNRPLRPDDKICCLSPREVELWKQGRTEPHCSHHAHLHRDVANERAAGTDGSGASAKFVGPRQIQVDAMQEEERILAHPKLYRIVCEKPQVAGAPTSPNFQLVAGVTGGRRGHFTCKTTKTYAGRGYTVSGIPASGGRDLLARMRVSEINKEPHQEK